MFVLVKYHNSIFTSHLRPTPAPQDEEYTTKKPIWANIQPEGNERPDTQSIETQVSQIRSEGMVATRQSRQSTVTPVQLQQMANGRVSQAQAEVCC